MTDLVDRPNDHPYCERKYEMKKIIHILLCFTLFICSIPAWKAYSLESNNKVLLASELPQVSQEEALQLYNETNNVTPTSELPQIPQEEALALYNEIKNEYESVKYEEFFSILNPRVSTIEKLNIKTALTKELGRTPTEDEVNARVSQIYMDRLGMRESFDSVMKDLDNILPRVLQNSYKRTSSVMKSDKFKFNLYFIVQPL